MAALLTAIYSIYRFHAMPIEVLTDFFAEIEKLILKFIWKYKRLQIAKAVRSKNSNTGGFIIQHLKLYYRATVRKTALC
jgi:hypothetical protein